MKRAVLIRLPSTDQGTTGILSCEGFHCFIRELPWRDNIQQKSCIPVGEYDVTWSRSPRFGLCYHVNNVPNRGSILIHAGNYTGNTDKSFRTHSHGCLLPAKRVGILDNQEAGLLSGVALRELISFFATQHFILEIQNAINTVVPSK